jgi:hypothetical protein
MILIQLTVVELEAVEPELGVIKDMEGGARDLLVLRRVADLEVLLASI